MSFDLLPNEMILKILHFMDLPAKVCFGLLCRRFYYLVRDGSLWSCIVWKRSCKIVDEGCLRSALRLSKSHLYALSISCLGKYFMFSKVVYLVQSCRSLQKISLSNVKLTSAQVRIILQLPCLLELIIEPETCVPLVLEGTQTISTSLKELSYVETGIYYQRLLLDWSNSKFRPACVKVLLKVKSENKLRAIQEITSRFLPSYPNNADLYIYQVVDDFKFASAGLILHISYTSNGPIVNFNDKNKVFDGGVIVNKSFGCSTAAYYPLCRTEKLDTEIVNLKSLFILHHHGLNAVQMMKIAELSPTLTTLDLKLSESSALEGVVTIVSACAALRSITLDAMRSSTEMINFELWKSMGELTGLHFLKLSTNLIPLLSEPVLFGSLRFLNITKEVACQHQVFDRHFRQFSLMPALKSFIFCQIPPIPLYLRFSDFLKSVRLTHLHLEKLPGNKLTLPLDPHCYSNLREFRLFCTDFNFPHQLAVSIGNNLHLLVLSLNVNFIEVKTIKDLFESLPSMIVFQVTASSRSTFRSNKIAKTLSKSLSDIATLQRRVMDICLVQAA